MTKLSRNIALILGLSLTTVAVAQTVGQPAAAPVPAPAQVGTGPTVLNPPPAVAAPTVTVPVNTPVPAGQTQAGQPQTQLPPPGVYGTAQTAAPAVVAPVQPPMAVNQPSPLPGTAPLAPPSSLPPLPGPNTAEVAYVQDSLMGVSPDQIRELKRMLDARQRASAELLNPPKPVTGSVSVSLSPGATPPVLRPYMGSTSSFVVLDSTGAPWPVENFRVANADLFPVNRLDGPQGSAFTVDTTLPYGQSNIILKLTGVAAPVVISLVAGQPEHDARVEVRIQGRGPNSTVAMGSLMQGADSRLLPVLDGIAPPGGKAVTVSGLDGVRAWLLPNGRLMVRSPVKIVSPASTSFVISADQTHVYEFAPTTQLLGLVDNQFVQMTVGGW